MSSGLYFSPSDRHGWLSLSRLGGHGVVAAVRPRSACPGVFPALPGGGSPVLLSPVRCACPGGVGVPGGVLLPALVKDTNFRKRSPFQKKFFSSNCTKRKAARIAPGRLVWRGLAVAQAVKVAHMLGLGFLVPSAPHGESGIKAVHFGRILGTACGFCFLGGSGGILCGSGGSPCAYALVLLCRGHAVPEYTGGGLRIVCGVCGAALAGCGVQGAAVVKSGNVGGVGGDVLPAFLLRSGGFLCGHGFRCGVVGQPCYGGGCGNLCGGSGNGFQNVRAADRCGGCGSSAAPLHGFPCPALLLLPLLCGLDGGGGHGGG